MMLGHLHLLHCFFTALLLQLPAAECCSGSRQLQPASTNSFVALAKTSAAETEAAIRFV